MARRKWAKNEIEQWRKENHRAGYFNKEDSNIFVPKGYGFGITFNWSNPATWIVIVVIIAVIVVIELLFR